MMKMNRGASEQVQNRRYRSWLSRESRGKMLIRRILGQCIQGDSRQIRPIRFEPLERRELMASDFYESAADQANSFLVQQ